MNIVQALCILSNIADGDTAKRLIVDNEDMLKKLTSYMVNNAYILLIPLCDADYLLFFCGVRILFKSRDFRCTATQSCRLQLLCVSST